MSNLTAVNELKNNSVPASIAENPDAWFEQKFEECFEKREANKIPSMSIIVTKGTLDWAYPPFILASTAAALGWDVSMFFTFYINGNKYYN